MADQGRKRSAIGKFFFAIFLIFNALMLYWMVSYWVGLSGRMADLSGDAETGTAAGGVLVTMIILAIWACGSVITGMLARLTR